MTALSTSSKLVKILASTSTCLPSTSTYLVQLLERSSLLKGSAVKLPAMTAELSLKSTISKSSPCNQPDRFLSAIIPANNDGTRRTGEYISNCAVGSENIEQPCRPRETPATCMKRATKECVERAQQMAQAGDLRYRAKPAVNISEKICYTDSPDCSNYFYRHVLPVTSLHGGR